MLATIHRTATAVFPLLLAGVILSFPTAAPGATKITRGPYLQLSTTNSIYVVWRTESDTTPVVRFGLSPDRLAQTTSLDDIVTRIAPDESNEDKRPKLHTAPKGTRQYEAHLKGLKPNTRYYYGIFNNNERLTAESGTQTFKTNPMPASRTPMRFWVVGDSGTGKSDQSAVHTALKNHFKGQPNPLDFYVHVGDMAYSKGEDKEFQNHFFDVYDDTLGQIVCWPSMGNHEGATSKGAFGTGPYYDAYVLPTRGEAGGVPSGLEAYYSFDYDNVHFICLDSHDLDRKPTGAMARWLRLDLANTSADWLIAFWHHPPYTKGSHDSDKEKQLIEMRRFIVPILESGGVDLVLTGHSHIYERSMLIDGAYATPTVSENVVLDDGDGDPNGDGAYRKSAGLQPNEGNVQIVAGHGGANISRRGTIPLMRRTIEEHGSVIVDVAGPTLTAVMLNKDGLIRDRFSIIKQGTVSPRRITYPWQPPKWTKEKPKPNNPPPASLDEFITAIPQGAEWSYLAGSHPEDDTWRSLTFNATQWKVGKAGFGFGDDDDATELRDMRNNYSTVYIRREFTINKAENVSELALMIRYDDAFIAYVNGKEVLRKGVEGSGKDASNVKLHSGEEFRFYKLSQFEKVLRNGRNVIAIEGHNISRRSSDFTLDPYLLVEE